MHSVLLCWLLRWSTTVVHLLASFVNATWRSRFHGICVTTTSIGHHSTPRCVVYKSRAWHKHAPAGMSLPCGSVDGSSLSTLQPATAWLAALCVGSEPSCWSAAFLIDVCLQAWPGMIGAREVEPGMRRVRPLVCQHSPVVLCATNKAAPIPQRHPLALEPRQPPRTVCHADQEGEQQVQWHADWSQA